MQASLRMGEMSQKKWFGMLEQNVALEIVDLDHEDVDHSLKEKAATGHTASWSQWLGGWGWQMAT